MTRRKVYVAVNADHKADGSCCPKMIRFDNDRKYEIDKVLQVCRAASEVGGRGIRYTVRIRMFFSRFLAPQSQEPPFLF